jgi:hypothetical protein
MVKRRKVPEDLMGTILGEEHISPQPRKPREYDREAASPAREDTLVWDERPERVGIAFNLSKQLNAELDRLREEIWLEGGVRPSRSEIAEAALRIAVEDVRERGEASELVRRLGGVDHAASTSRATRRSVDEAGFILDTVYDRNGEIVDEELVGNVADLPVETEYVDERGRLVSLAKDELGNTFEWVMDEEFNTLGARIIRGEE